MSLPLLIPEAPKVTEETIQDVFTSHESRQVKHEEKHSYGEDKAGWPEERTYN